MASARRSGAAAETRIPAASSGQIFMNPNSCVSAEGRVTPRLEPDAEHQVYWAESRLASHPLRQTRREVRPSGSYRDRMSRFLLVPAFLLLVAPSASVAQPIPLFDAAFRAGPRLENPPNVVSGDVNADGHIDLIGGTSFIYSGPSGHARIGVLPGRGDGTFGAPIEFDPVERVLSVEIADVDHNGAIDLLTLGATKGLTAYLGVGGGAFGGPHSVAIGEDCDFMGVGDVTGDSLLDVIAVGHYSHSLYTFLNARNGNFTAGPILIAPGPVYGIAVAHLTPDSLGDLVVATSAGSLGRVLTYRSIGGR